jgi:pyruvate dehydrogenase E2 component (dihydrolipoamide acetyltransferase)
MIRFELPALGADMDSGTLLEWRIKPGERVHRGQVVAVVDTSKAAVDVEIWSEGVVDELVVQPGQKILVGTLLATLHPPEEAAVLPTTATAAHSAAGAAALAAAPARAPEHTLQAPTDAAQPTTATASRRRWVSPAARRRAQALDIDVEVLTGSGAQGSITIADVEAAASGRTVTATPGTERMRDMRRAIAAAMSRSKREIPHYYLHETVAMGTALDWLARRNADLPLTARILPAALLLKAVALALRRSPALNGLYTQSGFEPSGAVHAGVAIALRGGGLVAPAIHHVADKPLEQLMRELLDLVKRARAGSLRSSEMSDPTITVTNLGDQGVESVFGVIYPPQVALVGFGRITARPWLAGPTLQSMPLLCATLAADHRVSDGHQGARFLAELRELLQRPQALDPAAGAAMTSRAVA